MKITTLHAAIGAFTALAGVISTARAGTIYSPTAVLSNSAGQYSSTYASTNMIGQAGLSTPFTSGVTNFTTYVAGNPTETDLDRNGWDSLSSPAFPITIDFDMGQTLNLTQLALWNSGSAYQASIDQFEVFTASSASFTNPLLVGQFTNTDTLDLNSYPADVFTLTPSAAEYVRIVIQSNYGSSIVNIGKLAFNATAAVKVPEPASIALLGTGLAGFALIRRRKPA